MRSSYEKIDSLEFRVEFLFRREGKLPKGANVANQQTTENRIPDSSGNVTAGERWNLRNRVPR